MRSQVELESSVATTSFVGRRRALATLEGRLDAERRVIVTGPPGVGKSRLALEALSRWRRRGGGLTLRCDLETASDRGDLLREVGRTFGVEGDLASARELGRVLAHRGAALLLLDGCDLLTQDASAALTEVLEEAPELRALSTARRPSGAAGEIPFELDPLPLDGHDDAGAIDLFRERSRTANGHDLASTPAETLRELVRRLDGLPLTIEIAASLMSVLSPEEFLARSEIVLDVVLPDEASNRRSLRSALTIAWERTSERARTALASFSIFRGGFDLRAAIQILGDASTDEVSVLVLLRELRSLSLLQVSRSDEGATRYALFESVRAYASEKLRASERARGVALRHAALFADVALRAAEAEGESVIPRAKELLAEEANVRAVIAAGLAEATLARHAVAALAGLLAVLTGRGQLAASAVLCDRAASTCLPHVTDLRIRALFELWAASAYRFTGDWPRSVAMSSASVTSARALGDDRLLARALLRHARVLGLMGEPRANVHALFDEADGLARRCEDAVGELLVAFARSAADGYDASHFDPAATVLADRTRDPVLMARAQAQSIDALAVRGRLHEARAAVARLGEVAELLGHGSWRMIARLKSGVVFHASGDLAPASAEIERARALSREVGFRQTEGECAFHVALVLLEERRFDDGLAELDRAAHFLPTSAPTSSYVNVVRAVIDARCGREQLARERLAETPLPGGAEALQQLVAFEIDIASSSGRESEARIVLEAQVRAESLSAPRSLIDVLTRSILARALQRVAAKGKTLRVGADASWLELPDQDRVPLEGRPVLRAILWMLVRERIERPGNAISRAALVAAIWPEEKRRTRLVDNRLNVALTSLRRLGLKDALVVETGRIRLDEKLAVEIDRMPEPRRNN